MLAKPIDPLTEEEAKSRHDQGKLYTAFSRRADGSVSVVLEVRLENDFVGIWDLDQYQRPQMRRVLARYGDRMFLHDYYSYGYGDSTELLTVDEAEHFLHRRIDPDGDGYTVERRKGSEETRSEISLKQGHTLDHYWTPVPAFGDYHQTCLVGIDPNELEQVLRDAGYEDA
jgi:hypothetical protein